MLTIRKLKEMIAGPLGLPAHAAYAAAREAGIADGLISGGRREAYALTGHEVAEQVLVMAGAGAGVSDAPAFLARIRATGIVPVLSNLLELAEAGQPDHLEESAITVDADGTALWVYVAGTNARETEIDGQRFGGKLKGRTFTVDGHALLHALFDYE